MKRLPIFLSFFFLAITLNRVAQLAERFGAAWMAWAFAAAVGAGVFTAGYWVDKKKDERLTMAAFVTLIIFMAGDMVFNVAETWQHMIASGLHDGGFFTAVGIVYAVFPTIAAAVLGYLQSQTDKIQDAKTSTWRVISDTVNAIISSVAPLSRQVAPPATDDAPALPPVASAPAIDAPRKEKTPAQLYAEAHGVSLRTAQRHLKAEMENAQ